MTDPAMESEPVLLEESRNGVRILRLNRPEKKNALSNELTQALVRSVEEAASDDEVRVVALTGVGGAFCSGADLSPRKSTDPPPESVEKIADRVVQLVTGIRVTCEKPVIAGIDGIAIGAGLALAMLADIRMASSAARFHPGYARVGTSPDCGLTWTLPAAIGREPAMRFFLEPEFHDANAALALGLVGEVVDDGDAAWLADYFLSPLDAGEGPEPLGQCWRKHTVSGDGRCRRDLVVQVVSAHEARSEAAQRIAVAQDREGHGPLLAVDAVDPGVPGFAGAIPPHRALRRGGFRRNEAEGDEQQ